MTRATLLAVLLAAAVPCRAAFDPFPYRGEGPFVIGPARTLAAPVYSTGFMLGALACLPISLAQNPRAGTQGSNGREASVSCGRWLGNGLGWPVYAAAGLPFFLLKKAFWDGPRALMPGKARAGSPTARPS
ncbi:MAG: hypothetical protein HYZ75_06420 [Elusimicrobia bacterium]|nr:hypothetical protein [Elusimicrobiota bacterium]